MQETVGILTALLSTLAWAIGTIKLKDIGENASPLSMTLVKSLYCAILLTVIAFCTHTQLIIDKQYLLVLITSGIIGITLGDCLFFASLRRLSPVVLSVILLSGPDVVTGILSFIILKEIPSTVTFIGIITTLFGLSKIIFPVKEDCGKSKISGYIFAFLSLICTAISTVIIKPVLPYVPTLTVTIYRLLFGGIALLLFTSFEGNTQKCLIPFEDKSFRKSFFKIMSLIAIGGFWLSIVAFKNINLITASTLMTLEPLFILLIMIIFFNYKPLQKEVIGITITVAGILLISYGEIW